MNVSTVGVCVWLVVAMVSGMVAATTPSRTVTLLIILWLCGVALVANALLGDSR